jgi:hypothetical protein
MEKVMVSPFMPPRYTLSVSEKHNHDSLQAEGWIGEKPCLVTIDAGASVTITRPHITAGLPEKDLQMASEETLPILKETLVEVTLGQSPIYNWVFVTHILNMFILGLDVMLSHDTSMDLRRHELQLGNEEVPLRHPRA